MGLLINKVDFIGTYKVAQNTYTDIDAYITKYEEAYLIDLLGVELFNLFKTYVTTPLTNADYLYIREPFKYDQNSCIISSEGMKSMLLGFVYWEYMRGQKIKKTISGAVVNQSENSREASINNTDIYQKFNDAIKTYEVIQFYIRDNKALKYPQYNGQCKRFSYWCI